MSEFTEKFLEISLSVLPVMLAVILHEIAHGYVAYKCGDATAKERGRLSLNPIRHVDLIGTIIIPLALQLLGSSVFFGYAKPVPINLARCRNPRKAFWLTAIAGPLCNLLQAVVGMLLLRLTMVCFSHFYYGVPEISNAASNITSELFRYWMYFLQFYACANIFLMVFNLIPIPPLDGSRVLTVLLPRKGQEFMFKLERCGFVILLLLLQFDFFTDMLDHLFMSALMGLQWLMSFL